MQTIVHKGLLVVVGLYHAEERYLIGYTASAIIGHTHGPLEGILIGSQEGVMSQH